MRRGVEDGRHCEDDALGIGAGGLEGRLPGRADGLASEGRVGFSSQHAGGPQFALGNATVATISPDIECSVFQHLLGRENSPPIEIH